MVSDASDFGKSDALAAEVRLAGRAEARSDRDRGLREKSVVCDQAVRLARQLVNGDIGLMDGSRALLPLLVALGEFEKGEFDGEFAAISLHCFETEPYPSESQRHEWSPQTLEHVDRWLPTLKARHHGPVMKACQKVIEKYSA